jgi:hypothetical protein
MEPNKKAERKKRNFKRKVVIGITSIVVGFLAGLVIKGIFEKPREQISHYHYYHYYSGFDSGSGPQCETRMFNRVC